MSYKRQQPRHGDGTETETSSAAGAAETIQVHLKNRVAANGSANGGGKEVANGNGHKEAVQDGSASKNGKKKSKFWNKFAGLVRSDVKSQWKDYDKTFTQANGEGITDKEHTTQKGVAAFYNLVTDIYEWGWGPSFHFSPMLKGKGVAESSVAHETRIADTLGLKPGTTVLDAGCGIGGPLVTIASHSGAKVVGITINAYQVERCKARATAAGLRLEQDFDVLQGDFLDLPFPDNSFDNVYSIEATCHSPSLEKAYGEIYRVLKPGGKFVNYEWVATPLFDRENADHVKCIDAINYANALPEMRHHSEIAQVARKVGFEVLEEMDLAANKNAGEWWGVLKAGMKRYKRNDLLVKILSFLRILPKVRRHSFSLPSLSSLSHRLRTLRTLKQELTWR
uniref:SAM-dependent methyltransferase Erg6/SMT-type domain-containing protein n=1 Tax=Chloropicon laureae TaxID=464258 RepID=A0A7S3E4N0_9CHLO